MEPLWFAINDLVKPTEMSVAPMEPKPMAAAPLNESAPNPNQGLPPVQPPSGRFIIQLFVVPGAIILAVVLVVLGFSYYGKRLRDPSYFLHQLDSDNADIRWRGASDLAQILKRPEPATLRWKADPKFALDLAERAEREFKDLLEEEKKVADLVAKSADNNKHLLWRKLRNQRDRVSFLGAALGEFHFAVGAPILCAILKHGDSPDLNGNTQQRRMALWALMNLGENLKGFAKIPAEQRQSVFAALKEEAAQGATARAARARTALYYLDPTALPNGDPNDITKVDEALAVSAEADDRFLRQLTAMAFNFWDGPHAEAILLKLANDPGHGTLIRVEGDD